MEVDAGAEASHFVADLKPRCNYDEAPRGLQVRLSPEQIVQTVNQVAHFYSLVVCTGPSVECGSGCAARRERPAVRQHSAARVPDRGGFLILKDRPLTAGP